MGKKIGIEKWLRVFGELVTAEETDTSAVVGRRARVDELLGATVARAHEAAAHGWYTREIDMAIKEVARVGVEFVGGRAPELLLRSAMGVFETAWQQARLGAELNTLDRAVVALANR